MPNRRHEKRMKAWRRATILAAIAGGFLIATAIAVQIQAGSLPPNEEPPVHETSVCDVSGDSKPWLDLQLPNYPHKLENTNTSSGSWSFTYKLVPEADLPFSMAPGSTVVVYHALSGYTGYYYGYLAPNGWWLMFYGQPIRDPVLIATIAARASP